MMTNAAAHSSAEPMIALPVRRMVASVAASAGGALALWTIAALAAGQRVLAEGAAGAGLVLAVGLLSIAAMRPWKARPVSTWTSLWLAALVGRLVVTPAAAWLLYSAAPLAPTPFLLAVGVTYVIVQVSEAAAVALHLKRIA